MVSSPEDLPIDIHCGKLLDWLLSRRHCNKDWQKNALIIREKIKTAILDMPESAEIVKLLQGSYINYFHCVRIIEILKETEKDTKNFLGYYSSQRMKDWQQIESLYKKDNVGLAESAQILQRLVSYEIPGLKKQITKADQAVQDAERKESDYARLIGESHKNYLKELDKLGLKGSSLRSELLALAADLPSFFAEIVKNVRGLGSARDHYQAFRAYMHRGSAPSTVLLPAIGLIIEKGEKATAYELKYGQVPTIVEPPNFDLLLQNVDNNQKNADDEDEIDFGDDDIDFGDSGEIDFGESNVQIDVVADDSGAVGELLARGEDALSLLENPNTQKAVINELKELYGFLSMRREDEARDSTSDALILSSEQRPEELSGVSHSQLTNWASDVQSILSELNNPSKKHLFKIRSSPHYVETLVESLEAKRDLEPRYKKLVELSKKSQEEAREKLASARDELKTVVDNTRQLQKQVQEEISKKYEGRRVNIMGGITAALAGV